LFGSAFADLAFVARGMPLHDPAPRFRRTGRQIRVDRQSQRNAGISHLLTCVFELRIDLQKEERAIARLAGPVLASALKRCFGAVSRFFPGNTRGGIRFHKQLQ
jgi:hypothetical protein